MRKYRSIILPMFFPRSMSKYSGFLDALGVIQKNNISMIEFYYQGNNKEVIKKELEKNNFKTIYLGAIAAKTKKLNLSSLDEDLRNKSIEEIKKCINDAYFYNSSYLLINSGPRPKEKGNDFSAYIALRKSIGELLKYAIDKAEDYLLNITLESGDINIDSFELVGSTDLAIKLAQDIGKKFTNFYLTMDTSHLRQLDEIPLKSIKQAFIYCHHIHLANCILKDKGSALYGDKHPEFGINKGEFSNIDIEKIYEEIIKLYKDTRIIVGLEIICREDNEIYFFEKTVKNLSWFFG